MKRLVLATAIVAAAMESAEAAQRITVPAQLPIKLVVDTPIISTVEMHPGDELNFHVREPVVVHGWIVISAGAKAYGHIVTSGKTTVEKGRGLFNTSVNEVNTNVVYAMDYIMSVEGTKIKLDGADQSPPRLEDNPYFRYGQLLPNAVVTSNVDHTVHILAKEKESGGSGGYAQ